MPRGVVWIVCVVGAELWFGDQPDRTFFERIFSIEQTPGGAEFSQHGCQFVVDLIKWLRTLEDARELCRANCLGRRWRS